MKEYIKHKSISLNNRSAILIISLLGAWIVSFPYEGRLLNTLGEHYGFNCTVLLDISLMMIVVGLILGGILVKTFKIARRMIIFLIPLCIILTVTFLFPSYKIWAVTINLCAVVAGICITTAGYYFKNIIPEQRFSNVAIMLILIITLRTVINMLSIYISIQAGTIFTIILLAAVWYITYKTPDTQKIRTVQREFDNKTGWKALILLFLFVAVIEINVGILTEIIFPKYKYLGWLPICYEIIPYISALLIVRNLIKIEDRSNILYTALGMMGTGFLLFFILDHSAISYLIINTIIMGSWAISDIFWWSILADMIEMVKNSARILSVGFSAIMIGVLIGKIIGDNQMMISNTDLPILPMAVICVTLIILPILNRLLSNMIKKNDDKEVIYIDKTVPDNKNALHEFPFDKLTEREKEVAELLMKGFTCKAIAAEMYLSENTIKTHVRNIYSKIGIKRKTDLFNTTKK